MRSVFSLFMISCALLAAAAGCASRKDDPVLAKYEGGVIRKSEIVALVKALPERIRQLAGEQKKDFVESVAMENLLCREAEQKGFQHRKDVQELLTQARKKILVAKLIEEEVDSRIKIKPEEARKYFDNHQSEFTTPYRLRASHILLRSREEADKVLAELKTGADFGEMAKKYSLDPTGPRGGDLGYFQKGQLIPEIEEVAFTLNQGEVSQPIQTSFGFHLIKVTDVSKPQLMEFSSVEKEIEARLLNDYRSKYFKELADRVKKKARLSLDEKNLSALTFEETPASS